MKNSLNQNTGPLDRVLRVFVGIALLTLATLAADSTISFIFLILGIPLLFSGITGFCPTYTLLGISTATPKIRMMPQKLQACCSSVEGLPSCPPLVKGAMGQVNDSSWGTPQDADTKPEGRER